MTDLEEVSIATLDSFLKHLWHTGKSKRKFAKAVVAKGLINVVNSRVFCERNLPEATVGIKL